MNLTLVHDWLNQVGGAEDVLHHLMQTYPDASIHTSIYDVQAMPSEWSAGRFQTLWLNHLPQIYQHHQRYLPLYPLAWGNLNLSGYDVVLSNKSGFCHGIKTDHETLHICYCLAPTRYVWQFDHYAARESLGNSVKLAVNTIMPWMRWWDTQAANKVNRFIAISHDIQDRIQKFYHRESDIIYPPVEVKNRFKPDTHHDDYFLSLGRLVPYKRVDIIVEACTRLGLPLKVGGTGRDMERLKAIAGDTVEFLGFVPDEDLPDLFAHCRAFVFPGFEDFGITPVQAQAAGRPVIAYAGGGALDTVIDGQTGVLVKDQSVQAFMDALASFDETRYSGEVIRHHALQFDVDIFTEQMTTYVEQAWDDFRKK